MKITHFGASLLLLHRALMPCSAYFVSLDCQNLQGGSKIDDVENAMTAWQNMANYAIGRASDPNTNRRQGNLLQVMLGATDENDQDTISYMKTWLNNAITTANDVHTVITCTDNHLTTIDADKGYYRDNTYGSNSQVNAPRSGPVGEGVTNACAGQAEAFTYNTGTHVVIVLCSDWPGAAMNSYDKVDVEDLRQLVYAQGSLITTQYGINMFSRRLVYKIAHEIMHGASITQFPANLPTSNGGTVPELYKYEKITGSAVNSYNKAIAPTATTLRSNADSFALLVCGWYMRRYVFTNGAIVQLTSGFPPTTYAS